MSKIDIPNLEINVGRRIPIVNPAKIGPSVFPHEIDQLKIIEYSSVPAGGKIESDLKEYYTLLRSVATNNATEEDIVALKNIMVRVRNYVVTEDDYNLMVDSIRATQEYLLNSIEAADGNFELVSTVASQHIEQLNEWSYWFQDEINKLATEKGLGGAVLFGDTSPGPSAFGYLWVNTDFDGDYVAPGMFFDEENRDIRGQNI